MPKTRTVQIYSFDELDPKVQAKVLDRMRQDAWGDAEVEMLTEIFEEILKEEGMPTKNIEWKLAYTQGDGVWFYGPIDLKTFFKVNDITALDPADFSAVIARPRGSRNTGVVEVTGESARVVGPDGGDESLGESDDLAERIRNKVNELSSRLQKVGYDQIEGSTSDEAVTDMIMANDYEFFVDGRIA